MWRDYISEIESMMQLAPQCRVGGSGLNQSPSRSCSQRRGGWGKHPPLATRWDLLACAVLFGFRLCFFPARSCQITVETEIFARRAFGQEDDLIRVP